MTGAVTANMGTDGNGKLQIKLELPLAHGADAKVAGNYQLIGNRVVARMPNWPPLSQVSAPAGIQRQRREHARETNARFLGGAVLVSISTRRDGAIDVNAQGTLDASALQSALGQPLFGRLRAAAPPGVRT